MTSNDLRPAENQKEQKSVQATPFVAALASLVIPGLGQILARKLQRGLILLTSFLTIAGLLAWRMRTTARYDTGIRDIIAKSFYLDWYLIVITVLLAILYIWIAYDAYRSASKPLGNPLGVFFMVIIIFFMLGWQIGQIDPVTLITQADDAGPALMRVLWPWSRAISYPEELLIGKAGLLSPCSETPFEQAPAQPDEPYLHTEPTCGVPSQQDGTLGTEIKISGENFVPDTSAEIWWEDPIGNEFRQRQAGDYVTVLADENGNFDVTVNMPYRLLPPIAGEGPQIWEVQARQVAAVGEAQASEELKLAVEKIIETIFIGMMATFFGIILAVPVSFVSARNLMSASPITMSIYYVMRALLNIIRSVEPLIWAIIFVIVVGLGPFAGILALTLHSIAALGKLYSEAIESIDSGPIEAIQATGANWVQTVIFAVIPQIIPPFVSFTIYRWDINIRMSTIIGFVGGGGIGFLLAQWIRLLDYRAAGIAVWFITLIVAVLDYVSAEIRARFV